MTRGIDPLAAGTALLALGIGVAYATFGTLGAEHVSYGRTQTTALVAMVLSAAASAFFVLDWRAPGPWWRSVWSAAFIAYAIHFWWAVFRTFDGDFGAIVARQGAVAYSNFFVTALWAVDVAVAWWRPCTTNSRVTLLHALTWFWVSASFIVAATAFRGGAVAALGYAYAALIAAAIVVRVRRDMKGRDPEGRAPAGR
jgi:hypothetical protein